MEILQAFVDRATIDHDFHHVANGDVKDYILDWPKPILGRENDLNLSS